MQTERSTKEKSKILLLYCRGAAYLREAALDLYLKRAKYRGLIAGKDVDKCKMKPISIKDGIALMSERDCDGMEDMDIFCCRTNEDVERAKAFIENRKKEQWEHL